MFYLEYERPKTNGGSLGEYGPETIMGVGEIWGGRMSNSGGANQFL